MEILSHQQYPVSANSAAREALHADAYQFNPGLNYDIARDVQIRTDYIPYNAFRLAGMPIPSEPEIETNQQYQYDSRNPSLTVGREFFADAPARDNNRTEVHSESEWLKLLKIQNDRCPVGGSGTGKQLWQGVNLAPAPPTDQLSLHDPDFEMDAVQYNFWGNAPGAPNSSFPIKYNANDLHPIAMKKDGQGVPLRPDVHPLSLQYAAVQKMGLDNDYAPMTAQSLRNIHKTLEDIADQFRNKGDEATPRD